MSSSKPTNKTLIYIIGGVLIVIGVLGALLTIGTLWHSPSNNTEESVYVANTVEYKIKIPHIKTWTNRTSNFTTWMEYFDAQSSYFSLLDTSTDFHSEIKYDLNISTPVHCKSDYKINIEQYLDGEKDGLFSISLKGTKNDRDEAFYLPFWPSSKYQLRSSQKCQRDEYQCYNSFVRSSKVSFSQPKEIQTCRDLVAIYPHAFNISGSVLDNKVDLSSQEIWYIQEYSGYLDVDTKYKIELELRYSSVDDAIFEHGLPEKGEWSIKLYSLENGKLTLWNNDVLKDITSAWLRLINHFGDTYCKVLY